MAYSIIVSPRAQKEIENAIEYYALYSIDAPLNFITILKITYGVLENDPFLRIRYKNIRAIKIKKFPYLLYFVINETNNTVRVLSCFHSKRNPQKRPNL
ncbi:type II toxin-antitoxin system RelE/ParE family toxin [Mucilaginibacter gotjawali]|uniref:Plasmid stabilization system protein n=2 Tax=Mucilaginibacter gotjawali TaxID=1550579 RepID=A0A0X8X023_9SPHI|nr:plasmid stabilization system protein ParE [Mucilaginibacter gotjawali]BAU53370.1 Plasmid stabilization system protein [Mucilaginibacter gotjawali]